METACSVNQKRTPFLGRADGMDCLKTTGEGTGEGRLLLDVLLIVRLRCSSQGDRHTVRHSAVGAASALLVCSPATSPSANLR